MRIELTAGQVAALEAQAAEQGLTLEDWFRVLAGREVSAANCRRIAHEAAARILDTGSGGKPDPEGA
ncbi:MAG TPA: hypothetical protein VKF41_12490 [Bryobacteraceae bacterium]|nr:hypothetical protein [Bryobacteraceae bacterium]